jgi:hypothetical protein
MATSTNIVDGGTYAGEAAGKYISAALLSGNTLSKGGLTIRPNIKYKEVVQRLEIDDIVKDGSCDFDPTSALTLTENILEPKEFQVNLQLCKQSFRQDWDAIKMGYSAHDNLAPNFQSYLISHVAAKVATKIENTIWGGADSAEGEFDGFATLLAADAGHTGDLKITGEAIDASNVIDELGKVVDAIPTELYGREDLCIYIPQNVYRAYVRSLGGFGAAGVGAAGYQAKGNNQSFGDLMFDGVKLFVANGLPSNKMIAATKDNLNFGTGLMNDSNLVKVLDMADLDGSQNVRFVMRYTAAVQYAIVEEIVSYGLGL